MTARVMERPLRLTPAEEVYRRERSDPQPGQNNYLPLSDLRLALETIRTDAPLNVLDYAAGTSPYRMLFPNAEYARADRSGDDLDYVLDGHRVQEGDARFDLVLATQALQYLPDPRAAFLEWRRLLRAGGRLIVTTHGAYEDYADSHDLRRWTAQGLADEADAAGFRVRSVTRLTTGFRAVAFLFERELDASRPRSGLRGLVRRAALRAFRQSRASFDRYLDRRHAANRVVAADEPGHRFYIGLLLDAERA